MPVQANANGVVNTTIQIPAGIPAGSKQVAITGAGGSRGEATFVGRGTIVRRELQQVTTQRVVRANVDPLAQTFTIPTTRLVAGADFYVKTKGSAAAANRIIVQIRGVTVGFPNDEVFAEGIVQYGDINNAPNATRCTWSPVQLDAGVTYALVILTDDPDHAVEIAQLGKFDVAKGQWVSSQPYQIGVLLSSSNAQTWTPHQDMDLRFRLLAAKFSQTERTIELGTATAVDATDLVVLAGVERPAPECDCSFEMVLDDGSILQTAEQQAAVLANAYSGDIQVRAKLRGSANFSPILYQGVQTVRGTTQAQGTYFTRAIQCDASSDLTVTFDRLTPGSSNFGVAVELDGSGVWTEVPFVSGVPVGSGYIEAKYKITGLNGNTLRVRLTLNGTAANRPRAKNLRCIVT